MATVKLALGKPAVSFHSPFLLASIAEDISLCLGF